MRDTKGRLFKRGDILRSDDYPFSTEEEKDNYYALVCQKRRAFFYYIFLNPKSNVNGLSAGQIGRLEEYNFEIIGNILG